MSEKLDNKQSKLTENRNFSYEKGEHIIWWQSLSACERFPIMQKHNIKQVNNKLIYKMWKSEN